MNHIWLFKARQVYDGGAFGLLLIKDSQNIQHYIRQDIPTMLTTGIPLVPQFLKDFPLDNNGFFYNDENKNIQFLQNGMIIRDFNTVYYQSYKGEASQKISSILKYLPNNAQCLYLDEHYLVYLIKNKLYLFEIKGYIRQTIIPLNIESCYSKRTHILSMQKDYFILSVYDGNMLFAIDKTTAYATSLFQNKNWHTMKYYEIARGVTSNINNANYCEINKMPYTIRLKPFPNMYQYQIIFIGSIIDGVNHGDWFCFSKDYLSLTQLNHLIDHIAANRFKDESLIQKVNII